MKFIFISEAVLFNINNIHNILKPSF